MEDFVTIATYLSLAEAEPHRLALEAAGIPTLATDESVGSMLVPTAWSAASNCKLPPRMPRRPKKCWLRSRPRPRKKRPKSTNRATTSALACPECGAEVCFPSDRRGHVEECPECGGYVDVPG